MFAKKVLVTRYGGAGDMIMLEPILEALYYKYSPAEIHLRTHPHYTDLHAHHPLIAKIVPGVLTENAGTPGFKSDLKKPDGYDLFYNTTGAIEMNRGIHGIDSFAFACSAPPLRRTPVLYVAPEESQSPLDIVVHTPKRSLAPVSPRNNDFRAFDIPEMLSEHLSREHIPFESITAIGAETEHENGLQTFASKIANCKLFIGPDSAGVHIAAATSVPKIVGAYTKSFGAAIRAYPNVIAVEDNDVQTLLKTAARAYTAPSATKVDKEQLAIVFSEKYAYGRTTNYEGKVLGGPFDLIRMFPGFLEQGNWRQIVWELEAQLAVNGVLYLYETHPKYNAINDACCYDPLLVVKFLVESLQMNILSYTATADCFGNFYIAAQKTNKLKI